MMVVYWATKLRGFLKHVSEYTPDVRFVSKDQYYEVSSRWRTLKSRLVRLKIFNPTGLFQVIKISGKECDFYGSFNRFLKSDKPYFIYLENPTALYHYALGRIQRGIGKRRFAQCLNDPNLKYIVCMSEACRTTFEQINMPLPEKLPIKTIYPLVPKNANVDEHIIRTKCYQPVLECLYCVQGKSFYTKGGSEILEVVTRMQDEGYQIHLSVITHLSALHEDTLARINGREGISLYDFTFSYEQMEKIYAKTAVLLQPSSADSFGLTVLESMKGGCAVLCSKLYAFPEMIKSGENGILIDPLYWTFTRENFPNPVAWGYEKKVRLSKKRSQKYIDDIENALKELYKDRDMLFAFAKNSLEIANTKFGEDAICDQWLDVWSTMKGAKGT